MSDSFGLNLMWLILIMMLSHQWDGWMWQVLHRIQEWGDDQLTHKMCAHILRKCLQGVLFPSNIKLCFCPFSDLTLVYLKDSLLKIPRLLFGTPFTFTKLCSCLSPLGTAWPSFSRQTLLNSLQSHTFLSSRCRFPNACKANASWSTAELFPYLCGFFWSQQKWAI